MATTKQLYYINNKENILAYQKTYYKDNVDDILVKRRAAYQENRDTFIRPIQCECGSMYTKKNYARHRRTAKHTEWINQQGDQAASPTLNEHTQELLDTDQTEL